MEEGGPSNAAHFISTIASGPVDEITANSDLFSIARISRGIPGLRRAIEQDRRFPFGMPCVLHSDPMVWPDDRVEQGINAQVLPLDAPSAGAFVPVVEAGIGQKHWVGANGDWLALVQEQAHWYLLNIYTGVEIEVPSVHNVEILHVTHNPFHYRYDMAHIRLNKIQIASAPVMIGNRWHYELIAVFDKFIAIMRGGRDLNWRVLSNDYLAPSRYVDAMLLGDRYYAVTAPRGDVLLWEPTVWGAHASPRVIPAPVIEEDPNEDADDDDVEIDSRCWFLVMGHNGEIVWVHTRGPRVRQLGHINHMGRELQTYPHLRCHVYSRNEDLINPLESQWVRLDGFDGESLFVGINYPFFHPMPEGAAVNAGEPLPVLKPDCVFLTHKRCDQWPKPTPDWCRIAVNGGPTIGSSFEYVEPQWGQVVETPVWVVPVLPEGWWGWHA